MVRAGLYGSSTFSFVDNLHTDFYGVEPVCISTSSVRVFFSPYPFQHFFLLKYFEIRFIYLSLYCGLSVSVHMHVVPMEVGRGHQIP